MTFKFDPELIKMIQKTGKRNIVVEIASSDHSDFEVTELYIHLANEKNADYLINEKHFHLKEADDGVRVLLPNYRLEYNEEVIFYVKHFLFLKVIASQGIRF